MSTVAQPLETGRTTPPVALETVTGDDGKFHDIPTLDLGGYLAGDTAARDELAAQLRYIQENIGFYYVVNHGIDRGPIDAAYAALEEFCALPMEEKLKVKINENSVGYIPPESTVYVTSVINENTEKDLNETITLARERAPDHPHIRAGYRFCGPNPWPESLPRFKTAMVDYQNEMSKLGFAMLPLYALALDKPADFFDPYFTEPTWWTRNAHYPPGQGQGEPVRHRAPLRPQLHDPAADLGRAGARNPDPRKGVDGRQADQGFDHRQYGRVPEPLDQRPVHADAAPGGAAQKGPLFHGHVLQSPARRPWPIRWTPAFRTTTRPGSSP